MKHLCDSNILVALSLDRHPNNPLVVSWLREKNEQSSLLICRAVQNSFLRLLTTPRVMGDKLCSNSKAILVYKELMSDVRFAFVSEEPIGLEAQWEEYAKSDSPSPKQWMDAYLAAFARCAKLKFVTLDFGFKSFPELDAIVLTNS